MPYTHSLSVGLQVAPAVAPLLKTAWKHAGGEWLERLNSAVQAAVDALTAAEPLPRAYEVALYLTTDAEIRALNRLYRGVDAPTDVLSFGYDAPDDTHPVPECPESPDLPPLGDLVISVETAHRQAALNRHDLPTELLMLTLHGTLHLMGYDDSTDAERAAMNARAVSTLRALGYPAREDWHSRYEKI